MALVNIPFLKKLEFPKLGFKLRPASGSYVGIDIGAESVKVVQLRKERERAILETYGELKSARYFQNEAAGPMAGFLGYRDQSVVNLLVDVLRESNVTTQQVVFSVPPAASFLTVIRLPLLDPNEIEAAVPFEAKKYIPIPLQEVALDWELIEVNEEERQVLALLAAVPNEVVAKYQRVAGLMELELKSVEMESFSLVRSLLPGDRGVSAIMNWGAIVTTVTVVDQHRIRMNHTFGRGAESMTTALAHSLGVTAERAEAMKRGVGLSEKPEEREIADVVTPIVDSILSDLERVMTAYNRTAQRKIEKIVLTGGGAALTNLVDYVAKRFGLETAIGNPFARTVYPPFLQPVLKEIAPSFAVAVGLALRQIATT